MTTAGDVPIERWVEEIIKRTVAEHIATCPTASALQKLQVRFSSLLAFMLGSGLVGGLGGGILSQLLTKP